MSLKFVFSFFPDWFFLLFFSLFFRCFQPLVAGFEVARFPMLQEVQSRVLSLVQSHVFAFCLTECRLFFLFCQDPNVQVDPLKLPPFRFRDLPGLFVCWLSCMILPCFSLACFWLVDLCCVLVFVLSDQMFPVRPPLTHIRFFSFLVSLL